MRRVDLDLAWWLDRWGPRLRRLREKYGWPQAWLQEFQDYLGQPRMTPEEFWVRYTLKRMEAEPRLSATMAEAEAHAFYTECDYMLWRNLVHRRHSTWWRVLAMMTRPTGSLLEFGCGIAPVASWVRRRYPDWGYAVEDLDGPAWHYASWRLARHDGMPPGWVPVSATEPFDVVTALDVFEHLADPESHARRLVERLASGGTLFTNFVSNPRQNDLDLASVEQRDATLSWLQRTLTLIWETGGFCVWQKPR